MISAVLLVKSNLVNTIKRNKIMRGYMYLAILFVNFTQVSLVSAQQDYFVAIRSEDSNIQTYARLVTEAHVDTIPGWLNKGRINDAVGDIKYALDRFPNHPTALQHLHMLARLSKNTGLAVNYFERAITLYPQYAITRAQYGLFLSSINLMDRAIEKFDQSIEIDPKLPAGYAGLAHAYWKTGDLPKARESAAKARELGFTGKLPDGL